MKWLKSEIIKNIEGLSKVGRDELIYKALPHLLLEIMRTYFRMEIEGEEHLPLKGRAMLVPNHSGFAGFDAVMLSHEIYKHTDRIPKILTHHLWFITESIAIPMNKMGFIEATTPNGLKHLQRNQIIALFPEGEYGNFKPSTQAYQLQEFKRGFVRMALTTQSPIIPTLIIGAEETHINLKRLRLSKYLRGTVLPLPLNILPLPARWKIKFLPAIHLPYKPSAANDRELVQEIAEEIQEAMQLELNQEIKSRPTIYF